MTLPLGRTSRNALVLVLAAVAPFVAAGTAMGQAPGAPAPPSTAYEKIAITDPEVQAAVKAAIANQRQKNHSDLKLLSVVSAERQPVTGLNMRLCLSLSRDLSGSTEHARVVLSRNPKKQWDVQIWSWGSCGR